MQTNDSIAPIDIQKAQKALKANQVIAYPTEAVYGLGCNPWSQAAVHHILAIKQRPESKGVILIISNWEQLEPLVDWSKVGETHMARVKPTWPGPVTWIFPKSSHVPQWVSGGNAGIAIRMTAHPVARALCQAHPIVSTSANVAGKPPLCSAETVIQVFGDQVAGVVAGELGGAQGVSKIYDVLSGKRLR